LLREILQQCPAIISEARNKNGLPSGRPLVVCW
jgi:hypothetical protein